MKKILLTAVLVLTLQVAACSSDSSISERADNIENMNQNLNQSKTVTKATTGAKKAAATGSSIKSSATSGTSSGKASAVKQAADAVQRNTTSGSYINQKAVKASEKAGEAAEILSVFESVQ